jgi:hypothetical protein
MLYTYIVKFLKQNSSLVMAMSIPLLMVLFIAVSVYLPRLFVRPKYNFLFAISDNYFAQKQLDVKNGQLTRLGSSLPESQLTKLENILTAEESKEISFADAQKLTLNADPKSPDGFEVTRAKYSGMVFPFIFDTDRDYNAHYLVGQNLSKKIQLPTSNTPIINFSFIGWIQ